MERKLLPLSHAATPHCRNFYINILLYRKNCSHTLLSKMKCFKDIFDFTTSSEINYINFPIILIYFFDLRAADYLLLKLLPQYFLLFSTSVNNTISIMDRFLRVRACTQYWPGQEDDRFRHLRRGRRSQVHPRQPVRRWRRRRPRNLGQALPRRRPNRHTRDHAPRRDSLRRKSSSYYALKVRVQSQVCSLRRPFKHPQARLCAVFISAVVESIMRPFRNAHYEVIHVSYLAERPLPHMLGDILVSRDSFLCLLPRNPPLRIPSNIKNFISALLKSVIFKLFDIAATEWWQFDTDESGAVSVACPVLVKMKRKLWTVYYPFCFHVVQYHTPTLIRHRHSSSQELYYLELIPYRLDIDGSSKILAGVTNKR